MATALEVEMGYPLQACPGRLRHSGRIMAMAILAATLAAGCGAGSPPASTTADDSSDTAPVAPTDDRTADAPHDIPPIDAVFDRTSIAPEDAPRPARRPDVVYVPTPQLVVDAMLEIADVGPDDVVYDLGSGDGRIPITAARRWGARGVGIELHPQLVRDANLAAHREGLDDKVTFLEGDMFEIDLGSATVVTLYLLPDLNLRLRSKLLRLAPGTRIVTHNYHMGDWAPERQRIIGDSVVYAWTVPAEIPPHLLD